MSQTTCLFEPLTFLIRSDIWMMHSAATGKLDLGLDAEILDNFRRSFALWLPALWVQPSWKVVRSYMGLRRSIGDSAESHVSGETSGKSSSTCTCMSLYIMFPDCPYSALVMSKARVAPAKVVSLPHLPLLGMPCCRPWSSSSTASPWPQQLNTKMR